VYTKSKTLLSISEVISLSHAFFAREDADIFEGDLLSSKQSRPRQWKVFASALNAVTEVAAELRKARKPAICRLRLSTALIRKPTSLIAACRRIAVVEILGCHARSAVIRTQRVYPTTSAKWSPSLRQHAKALGIPMNIYRSSLRTILRSRQVYARIRHLAKLIGQSSVPVCRVFLGFPICSYTCLSSSRIPVYQRAAHLLARRIFENDALCLAMR